MHVVIFESNSWRNFAPITLARPLFAVASGMSILLEKQLLRLNPSRLTLWVRPEFADYCRTRIVPKLKVPTAVNEPLDDEPALLINARSILSNDFDFPREEAVALFEDLYVHSAYVRSPGLSWFDLTQRTEAWQNVHQLPHAKVQGTMAHWVWDLIARNEQSLTEDSQRLHTNEKPKPPGPYHMINDAQVFLGQEVKLEPGVVLDASRGPVIVHDSVTVGANTVIKGPCYIGPGSVIRALSLIGVGTSIGPACRVGGETINSIILGYSNKAHDGFLGDSYVGKWVNLGAGTNTSNLKNTYGTVNVEIGSHEIDTGRQFLGALVGDHTKTAIGTRLMTGTYVGFCAMVASTKLPPKCVPSFTFLTDRGAEPYRLAGAIQMVQRMFARRNRTFTLLDRQILDYAADMAPALETA